MQMNYTRLPLYQLISVDHAYRDLRIETRPGDGIHETAKKYEAEARCEIVRRYRLGLIELPALLKPQAA